MEDKLNNDDKLCPHGLKQHYGCDRMTNDDKDFKPMTIEEVYKKYNIDNSKKKSIYLWEFQVITQEFVSDMWEAIKHHATRPTPQKPNGYDMDGNPIQYGLSGGSQQPSELLKELDEKKVEYLLWEQAQLSSKYPSKKDILPGDYVLISHEQIPDVAKAICSKFGQPSEPLKELDDLRRLLICICQILDGPADMPMSEWDKEQRIKLGQWIIKLDSFIGDANPKKSKAEAIHEAIRNADVGDDIVIHNEDMSVWCILNLVTREHPERESNGKDRS